MNDRPYHRSPARPARRHLVHRLTGAAGGAGRTASTPSRSTQVTQPPQTRPFVNGSRVQFRPRGRGGRSARQREHSSVETGIAAAAYRLAGRYTNAVVAFIVESSQAHCGRGRRAASTAQLNTRVFAPPRTPVEGSAPFCIRRSLFPRLQAQVPLEHLKGSTHERREERQLPRHSNPRRAADHLDDAPTRRLHPQPGLHHFPVILRSASIIDQRESLTMPMLDQVLDTLREQRDQFDTAISALEGLNGGAPGSSNKATRSAAAPASRKPRKRKATARTKATRHPRPRCQRNRSAQDLEGRRQSGNRSLRNTRSTPRQRDAGGSARQARRHDGPQEDQEDRRTPGHALLHRLTDRASPDTRPTLVTNRPRPRGRLSTNAGLPSAIQPGESPILAAQ